MKSMLMLPQQQWSSVCKRISIKWVLILETDNILTLCPVRPEMPQPSSQPGADVQTALTITANRPELHCISAVHSAVRCDDTSRKYSQTNEKYQKSANTPYSTKFIEIWNWNILTNSCLWYTFFWNFSKYSFTYFFRRF